MPLSFHFTLWLFDVAMENPLKMVVLMGFYLENMDGWLDDWTTTGKSIGKSIGKWWFSMGFDGMIMMFG